MDNEIKKIIETLGLEKLWDCDYIKEEYSSDVAVKLGKSNQVRPLFNWAYYLMPQGSIFPLHKLLSDESWQYCLGGPVDLFLIKNGEVIKVRVGPKIHEGEKLLYIVPKSTWFAATPALGSKFTLITHCVSPGWAPEDDFPGLYSEMIKLAPKHKNFVEKFSWPENRRSYTSHDTYKEGLKALPAKKFLEEM